MRAIILILVAASSAGVAAVADPPPTAMSKVVTSPDWLVKPSAAEVVAAYPRRALIRRIGGTARVTCVVTVDGETAGCEVLAEDPPGVGFGPAALKLSHRFRFRPRTVDGIPEGGAIVIIPFRFEIPPEAPRGPTWLDWLLHKEPATNRAS
jgi:protein TonB